MSHVPLYVEEGTDESRYRTLLVRGCAAAALAHLAFIGIFLVLGSAAMALLNLGSVGLYAYCWRLLRREATNAALLLSSLEVLAHAACAVQAVGWASGFHFYLFVMVPLGVFHPRWSSALKFGYVALLCVSYLLLALQAVPSPPAIDPRFVSLVASINIAATFLLLGYLAYYYNQVVNAVHAQLGRLATTDPLTGLLNRRRAEEIVAYETMRRAREARPLAVVLADIDGFKGINDRYGHETGDAVLLAVARRLRGMVRAQDALARWGGEEFLLILPGTTRTGAMQLAEKVRRAVEQLDFGVAGTRVALSLTLGVSEQLPGEAFGDALARADEALLRGKRLGKNRVESESALAVS